MQKKENNSDMYVIEAKKYLHLIILKNEQNG
jgi:hypothetical protein